MISDLAFYGCCLLILALNVWIVTLLWTHGLPILAVLFVVSCFTGGRRHATR
jgi:hypothetical protein